MTGFQSDDTLSSGQRRLLEVPRLEIPRLGRSGCEHRMQYLLRSVEWSTKHDGSIEWKLRQMAVYHSFDFITGKALWINIKPNDIMRKKIKEATAEFPMMSSNALGTVPGNFTATMLTHLIHLDWCDENWRSCINHIERKIREILVKATTARIDQQPKLSASPAMKRALTMGSSITSPVEVKKKLPAIYGFRSFLKWPAATHDNMDAEKDLSFQAIEASTKKNNDDLTKQFDSLRALDMFSFQEMQNLHYFGEQLESYRLVMDLNRQTLRDITEHYTDLMSRDEFPEALKECCKDEMASFAQRVERIRKNLEIRSTQVKSLIAWLQDGKSLVSPPLSYLITTRY